jgi:hypothetical protein
MCKRGRGVSMDNLLYHCEIARTLWNVFFSHLGLSWVIPRRIVDLFACWWTGDSPHSVVRKMVPPCLLWCL